MRTINCPNCLTEVDFDEYDDHEFLECPNCADTFCVDEVTNADGEIDYIPYFI